MPRLRTLRSDAGYSLNQREMNAVVAAHENFVLGRPNGARALLRMAVAPRVRIDKRTLRDADFTGAQLVGASFRMADLERAAFYCANLGGCDFRGSNLKRSDLRGAGLAGANLGGAVLDEADIRSAVLYLTDSLAGIKRVGARSEQPGVAASLRGASLAAANLDDTVAYSVDFTNCSLKGARLRNANLKNANFSHANLDGVDLKGAKLAGATFGGAIMTGIRIAELNFAPGQLTGCVLDPTPEAVALADQIQVLLDQAETWIQTQGKRGGRAVLDGLDLRPVRTRFHGRILPALSAKRTCSVGIDFSDSQLQGASFEGADLRGANFTGADLRGVSFRGAQLAHARFTGAELGALQLHDGKVRPVDVAGATLDGTGLLRAIATPTVAVAI